MSTPYQKDKCPICFHDANRQRNGICRAQIWRDERRESTRECVCTDPFHFVPVSVEPKTVAVITQTNPDVLMLPVLHNGELIGRMSLRREAVPTEPEPFQFAIGYRVEEGKLVVYEVTLAEGNPVREYLKRLVNAGISFSQAVRVSEKQLQLQPVSLDEAVAVASDKE